MSAWCVAFLGATFLLLVVAESPPLARTKRLTSFSKPVETETKIPRGKECSDDNDCKALEFTTCKKDTDQQQRCLCHDLQAPTNGECATKRRELHQACSYDSECIYGAECIVNSTIKAGEKRCYCKFGYEEEDNECNSGHIISAIATLVLFTTLALLITRPN